MRKTMLAAAALVSMFAGASSQGLAAQADSAEGKFCGRLAFIQAVHADEDYVSSVTLFSLTAKDDEATPYDDRYLRLRQSDHIQALEQGLRRNLLDLYEETEDGKYLLGEQIDVCIDGTEFYTRKYRGKFYRYAKRGGELTVTNGAAPVDPRQSVELPEGGYLIAAAIADQLGESISQHCVFGTVQDSVVHYLLPLDSKGYDCGHERHSISLVFSREYGRYISSEVR